MGSEYFFNSYVSFFLLQDGVHREMWSSDTAFQWKIPENPTGHSRWVSLPLLYMTLTSPLSFLSWKIIILKMRNFPSNSIMVISHLRSAGELDRLCTLLFLTPDASCHGYGWIADGYIRRSLPLPHLSLPFYHCLSPSVVVLPLQPGTSWAGENPLNIHTHAPVLFFAIYLRACTLPSFLSCFCSLLPCPLSFLSLFSAVTLDSGTSWWRRKQAGKRGWKNVTKQRQV